MRFHDVVCSASTWRDGLNNYIADIEPLTVKLLQKELDEQSLGITTTPAGRVLVARKPLREGETITVASALWYDDRQMLESMLNSQGHKFLSDRTLRVTNVAHPEKDEPIQVFGVLVGAARHIAHYGTVRKQPNAVFEVNVSAGACDQLVTVKVRTRNCQGIAAGAVIAANLGIDFSGAVPSDGGSDDDDAAVKRFRGALDAFFTKRETETSDMGGGRRGWEDEENTEDEKTKQEEEAKKKDEEKKKESDEKKKIEEKKKESDEKKKVEEKKQEDNVKKKDDEKTKQEDEANKKDEEQKKKESAGKPWSGQDAASIVAENRTLDAKAAWGALQYTPAAKGGGGAQVRVWPVPGATGNKKIPPGTVLHKVLFGEIGKSRGGGGVEYALEGKLKQIHALLSQSTKPLSLAEMLSETGATSIAKHDVKPPSITVLTKGLSFHATSTLEDAVLGEVVKLNSLSAVWIFRALKKDSENILTPRGLAITTAKQLIVPAGGSMQIT